MDKQVDISNKTYILRIPLWRTSVHFIVGDKDYFNKQAYRICKFQISANDDCLGFDGRTYNLIKEGIPYHLIWMESFDCTIRHYEVLSHEALHASIDILDSCGVPINADNQEVMAYTHGHVYCTLMSWATRDWKKLNNFNI